MLYKIGRFLLRIFYKVFCKLKYIDGDRIPKTGGLVLASNHVSYHDPFVVGLVIRKRRVNYMAKTELFEQKYVGRFITIMGAFPVERDKVDRKAIKKAVGFLKNGEVVGMFPEGTRSKDGKVGEGKHGAAMLSLMADVPIVPAAVTGTLNAKLKSGIIPKYKQVTVKYGDPIYPNQFEGSRKEKMYEITDKVIDSIRKLKEDLEA